jgi:hypothetical protein
MPEVAADVEKDGRPWCSAGKSIYAGATDTRCAEE